MRLYISADMEGVSGITDWSEIEPPGEQQVKLLLMEVNAAIQGALAAGVKEVLVNDGHGTMRNLPAHLLNTRADLIQGAPKPLGMLAGLDSSFDAVFLIGYHGRAGGPGNLSHTYTAAVHRLRVNSREMGETGLAIMLASHLGVPVALVTGDRAAVEEARMLLPGVASVAVKEPMSHKAAQCLHPSRAREMIRQAAAAALSGLARPQPGLAPAPCRFEIEFQEPGQADAAAIMPGCERLDSLTLAYSGQDFALAFRGARALLALARQG